MGVFRLLLAVAVGCEKYGKTKSALLLLLLLAVAAAVVAVAVGMQNLFVYGVNL